MEQEGEVIVNGTMSTHEEKRSTQAIVKEADLAVGSSGALMRVTTYGLKVGAVSRLMGIRRS